MRLTSRWSDLPPAVRRHLVERLKDRRITIDDLAKLQFWLELQPDVPEGDWYKDFGSFVLAGRGPLILTFLSPGQIPYGIEIAEDDLDD